MLKFILRNNRTGRYLKRAGLWVDGMDEAMTFEEMVDVREYCQAHQLKEVQPVQHLMPYLMSLLRNGKNPSELNA